MTPIAELVQRRMRDLNLSRSTLVDRCCYKNSAKALRRLDALLAGDLKKAADLIARLPTALDIEASDVSDAAAATQKAIEAHIETAERAGFRPHAILLTQRPRPSSITMAAFTGIVRQLRVDFESGSEPFTFVEQTQSAIHDRQLRYGGFIPFFGPVVGFVINYQFELAVNHDLAGNITKVEKTMKRQPITTLELVGGGSVLTVLKQSGS